MKGLGVTAGDGVFILGFPMDLAGKERNYVIVRQGSIARVDEMLDRASLTFMLDAFVFPGNSGAPVVLKPEVVSIVGTMPQSNAYLVGMVIESRFYVDTAYSLQTSHARITFEENAGLAEALPMDYVDEAVKTWSEVHPQVSPQ